MPVSVVRRRYCGLQWGCEFRCFWTERLSLGSELELKEQLFGPPLVQLRKGERERAVAIGCTAVEIFLESNLRSVFQKLRSFPEAASVHVGTGAIGVLMLSNT